MKLIVLLALMVLACGESATDPVLVSYTLSPDADIFGFTQRAVYRWNEARGCQVGSGCELTIGEDGVPVQYVEEILMPELGPDGEPMRATGSSQPIPPVAPGGDWLYVHVSLESGSPERTLVHELAHVLGLVEHTHTGVTHGQRGLNQEQLASIQAWSITAEVLEAVCSQTMCLEMNPE